MLHIGGVESYAVDPSVGLALVAEAGETFPEVTDDFLIEVVHAVGCLSVWSRHSLMMVP